jgi:hypothetical protein
MQGDTPRYEQAPPQSNQGSRPRGAARNDTHLLPAPGSTCRRDGSHIHTLLSGAAKQTRRKERVDQITQQGSQTTRGREDATRTHTHKIHGHIVDLDSGGEPSYTTRSARGAHQTIPEA